MNDHADFNAGFAASRLKELNDENERLRDERDSFEAHYIRIAEENERLRARMMLSGLIGCLGQLNQPELESLASEIRRLQHHERQP